MFDIDPKWLTFSTFLYNSTVVMMSIGVVFTWIKHRTEKVTQHKHSFLSCTARYLKIQELLMTTKGLSELNLSIYLLKQDQSIDTQVFSKELAVCGMMFQLMEDVWLMHNLERHQHDKLYAGWYALFTDWMQTEKIAEKWSLLKSHFSTDFVIYVDKEFCPQHTSSVPQVKAARVAHGMADDAIPKDVEKYGDILAKAWEQYLKIIDLLIALAGATALIMVNLFKEVGQDALYTEFGIISILCFAVALFFLAFWRFSAQHFFEYETLGNTKIATRYYQFNNINPITKAHIPIDRLNYRKLYKLFSVGSGVMLGLSWLSLLALLLHHA